MAFPTHPRQDGDPVPPAAPHLLHRLDRAGGALGRGARRSRAQLRDRFRGRHPDRGRHPAGGRYRADAERADRPRPRRDRAAGIRLAHRGPDPHRAPAGRCVRSTGGRHRRARGARRELRRYAELPPGRDGGAQGGLRADPGRHYCGGGLGLPDAGLYLVPIRASVRHRRGDRAHPRRGALARNLRGARTRIQFAHCRRDSAHRRLFDERHRGRVRPRARELAQVQDDVASCAAQPERQPDPVPHRYHLGDDTARPVRAPHLRRCRHPRLQLRHDLGA